MCMTSLDLPNIIAYCTLHLLDMTTLTATLGNSRLIYHIDSLLHVTTRHVCLGF